MEMPPPFWDEVEKQHQRLRAYETPLPLEPRMLIMNLGDEPPPDEETVIRRIGLRAAERFGGPIDVSVYERGWGKFYVSLTPAR